MSANIDTMLYVGERPWHNLGVDMTKNPPSSSQEIICSAGLDWTVNSTPMYTELHEFVPNYHVIYREDRNTILGVVNRAYPVLVQNTDTFNSINGILGEKIDVETAASLGRGETVFGCFQVREQYRVLDDDIDHYFVIVNDHLKVDGKVTVLNTPIRVVCQNTLSEALHTTMYKMRIPMSKETSINSTLAKNMLSSVDSAIGNLKKRGESMVGKKIDKAYVDRLLDVMFPYQLIEGEPIVNTTNERISIVRDTFIEDCMGADNLGNYRGTQWQVYNALTDFCQHYYTKADHAYDLNHRMSKLPGVVTNAEQTKAAKYLKIADQLAA